MKTLRLLAAYALPTMTLMNTNQGGGGGPTVSFGANSDPFSRAGTNIFDTLAAKNSNTNQSPQGMEAPQGQNGMPQGTNPPPLESMQANPQNQWAPQQGQQAPQQSQTPQEGGSPLDKFNPVADNNPNNQAPQTSQAPAKSIFDTDIEGWGKATTNVDISSGIEPAKVQAALAGDANVFMEILNTVGRNAMNNAAHMATKAAGHGVNSRFDSFKTEMPDMINNHQFSTMWEGDKVMNHPTAAPMVQALTTQFRGQFPQATQPEIQAKVQEYMQQFGGLVNAPQTPTENTPDANQQGGTSLKDFFS